MNIFDISFFVVTHLTLLFDECHTWVIYPVIALRH
jgi:hypothetical protein